MYAEIDHATHLIARPIAGRAGHTQNTPVAPAMGRHSMCFICSRLYFDATFDRCRYCGRNSIEHLSTEDLALLSRGAAGMQLEARPRPELLARSADEQGG